MHGDLNQEQRERAMAAFKAGKKDILIATDVAARGIDVDDVTHVINHTIPDDDKTYLHRAGRTGRAGKTGIAVTFVDWDDMHKWALINRALEFGQPEPAETYSSSPHLFTDLDIPAGTKGRLKPASAVAAPHALEPPPAATSRATRHRRAPAAQSQPQPHPRRPTRGRRVVDVRRAERRADAPPRSPSRSPARAPTTARATSTTTATPRPAPSPPPPRPAHRWRSAPANSQPDRAPARRPACAAS